MSDNDDEVPESGDYLVWYKKPPKATQFSKGETGNPRGRPRKPKPEERTITFSDAPYDAAFREEIYRKLKLRENGEEIELTAQQAIMRTRIMSALKGNRFAQKAALEEIERKEQEYFQRKIDRCIYLNRAKRDGERKLAEAKKNNTEPPKLLPHPDDIVVNLSTGDAYVTGPETEEDEKFCEYSTRFRDYLLLKAVDEGEIGTEKPKGNDKSQPSYLLLASLMDQVLPARYRWQYKETKTSARLKVHLRRRKLADCPPGIDLALDFMNLSRKERAQRIAEEFSELRANRPPATRSHNSKETKKMERILEGILIKMNKAA